jgi:hypothetical protein
MSNAPNIVARLCQCARHADSIAEQPAFLSRTRGATSSHRTARISGSERGRDHPHEPRDGCYIACFERFMSAPPAQRHTQPDGAVLFLGTHLRVRIAVLKPGFVLATARGEVADAEDASAETAVLAELERELERTGTLTLFADLRESRRMPSASREKIALWMHRNQARLRPSHVLVSSKLLEMALSIITMLVGSGSVKIHVNPQKFLDLVKQWSPTLTELPRVPD